MKKKIIVGLLILGLLAGSFASIFIGLGLGGNNKNEDPFAGVPAPVIRSNKWQDFSGVDLSNIDLSNDGQIFHTFSFDSHTLWPEKEKMPLVTPEEIMEQGKYLGLGLWELHQRGIMGDNISVAVIDDPISDHVGNSENITYIQVDPESSNAGETSHHGRAVAGIFAGENGVAPGAHLYYFAVPEGQQPCAGYAMALDELLAVQETLDEQNKIKVVSISSPKDTWASGEESQQCLDALERVREQGIIVVYSGMAQLELTGAGCPPGLDRDNPDNYEVWSKLQADIQIIEKLKNAAPESWDTCKNELIRLFTEDPGLDEIQAFSIYYLIYSLGIYREHIEYENWFEAITQMNIYGLAVPVDYLTVLGQGANSSDIYCGAGDIRWAVTYIAGLMALGLQVNPEATLEQMAGLLWDTGFQMSQTARLVNPVEFIEGLLDQ